MKKSRSRSHSLVLLLIAGVGGAAVQAGCGTDGSEFGGFTEPDASGGSSTTPTPGFGNDDPGSNGLSDASDTDAQGTLVITPASATITVIIVNGVVTVNAPAS